MRTLTLTLTLTLASLVGLTTAHAQDAAARVDRPRARLGVGVGPLMGSAGTHGSISLLGLGTHLRLGYQANDLFAVYYQGSGLFGARAGGCITLFGSTSCESGAGLIGLANSVVADVTPANWVHVGVGPSYGVASVANDVSHGPGFTVRTAFTFGSENPREGFTAGVQFDVLFLIPTGYVVTVASSLGIEYF